MSMKENKITQNHYYELYENCSQDLRLAYERKYGKPKFINIKDMCY